jgi:hypothetical protein
MNATMFDVDEVKFSSCLKYSSTNVVESLRVHGLLSPRLGQIVTVPSGNEVQMNMKDALPPRLLIGLQHRQTVRMQ